MSQVDALLLQITDGMIQEIFHDYTVACYGHLQVMPINEDESLDNKRQALRWWLEVFEKGDGQEDERQDVVLKTIKNEPGALAELVSLLQDDQHFQEPLYHMLNQKRKDPDFGPVIQRLMHN